MSETATVKPGPRTQALLDRAATLERALDRGGDRIPDPAIATVRSTLVGVRERLALGVDTTIVALAGGTGSGKSSLFNALSGLNFADVGIRRPTTAQVTACVWGSEADPLLEWLGVDRDRWMERESALDGETQSDLRGLLLLDLPDHDSIEPKHRVVVDRLLPQADLLVWVVDPQKYADDVLHSRYLRSLAGHEGAMLVLLNQMDTVPFDAQVTLLRDASRLLREDGLVDVGVHAVSAKTGEGLPIVRGVLAHAVAGRHVAEIRATAEMDDAARVLAGAVAEQDPDAVVAASVAVAGLEVAAGVSAAAATVDQAVRKGTRTTVNLGPVQPDRVAAVRQAWLDDTATGMPTLWASALLAAVPPAETFAASVDERLAGVEISIERPRSFVVLRLIAAVLGVFAVAAAGFTVSTLVGAPAWDGSAELLTGVMVACAVLGITVMDVGRWKSQRAAGRRASAVSEEALLALVEVVNENLVVPTVAVLNDHRAVREALSGAEPTPVAAGDAGDAAADVAIGAGDGSGTDAGADVVTQEEPSREAETQGPGESSGKSDSSDDFDFSSESEASTESSALAVSPA